MESRETDLYYNGKLIIINGGDGLLQRELIDYPQNEKDLFHVVQQGDTVTGLAWRYYKNRTEQASRNWKYICDCNNILNPLDISDLIGTEIRIPNEIEIKHRE